MSAKLFEYPKKAEFGKHIPKSKIYGHARTTEAVKKLFVKQVDRIVWEYKLAPSTINVPAVKSVPEIQIISIVMRSPEIDEKVLNSIDRAIPHPLIFELRREGQIKIKAAYKRPGQGNTKWPVISGYFETKWMNEDVKRIPLPVARDLSELYAKLMVPLLPFKVTKNESFANAVERMESIVAKKREVAKLKRRVGKERQFNRRIELNHRLRLMETEVAQLIGVGKVTIV